MRYDPTPPDLRLAGADALRENASWSELASALELWWFRNVVDFDRGHQARAVQSTWLAWQRWRKGEAPAEPLAEDEDPLAAAPDGTARGLAAVLLFGAGAAADLRRRRRRNRTRVPAGYARALRLLARRGHVRGEAQTARDFARGLAEQLPPAAASAFATITDCYLAERFGVRLRLRPARSCAACVLACGGAPLPARSVVEARSRLVSAPGDRQSFVFLDRDGTLVRDGGYVHRLEDYALLPGVVPALHRLAAAGFELAIVTNQSGIGRGLYDESAYRASRRISKSTSRPGRRDRRQLLLPPPPGRGLRLPQARTGTVLRARDVLGAELGASFAIGNALRDAEAASRPGAAAGAVLDRPPRRGRAPAPPRNAPAQRPRRPRTGSNRAAARRTRALERPRSGEAAGSREHPRPGRLRAARARAGVRPREVLHPREGRDGL